MHLNGKVDIEASVKFVYDQLADFSGWETAAMRRGADVHRTDKMQTTGPGMAWKVRFPYRGKQRDLAIRLVGLDHQTRLTFAGDAPTMAGTAAIDLLELAAKRTRLTLVMDLKPATLGARLFVQSMKLARGRVQGRFDQRLKQLALDIEDRYRRSLQR